MTQLQGTNFELVGDFMEAMDQEIQIFPVFPDEHIQRPCGSRATSISY